MKKVYATLLLLMFFGLLLIFAFSGKNIEEMTQGLITVTACLGPLTAIVVFSALK